MPIAERLKAEGEARKQWSKGRGASMKKSIASLISDEITLSESVKNLAVAFAKAQPFPHIVIDNLFSSSTLDKLIQEIPPKSNDYWVHENNDQLHQYNLRSAVELGETGRQFVAFLHSASFLYFLSEVTGIWELLPDPYLQGSGYHLMPSGGSFDVHIDRNTAYEIGLTRRLSLIVYLNKNWKSEYGGQFELWNSDATRCEKSVEPLFNRTVIFEVADGNYHGVPNPIAAPKGRSRDCFLVYYHTVGLNGRRDVPPHTSIYAPSFYAKNNSGLRKWVRDFTPPIVLRTLKRVRQRAK